MPKFVSKTFAAPLAALALMAGSSVALAAGGAVPGFDDPTDAARPTALPTPAHAHAHEPSDEAADDPTDEPGDDATETPKPEPTPRPSLVGLCHAYEAGGYANSTMNGHVNPAWKALEDAAGGRDNLATFCADTLAQAKPHDDHGNGPDADKPHHWKPWKAEHGHGQGREHQDPKPENHGQHNPHEH